MTSEIAVKLDEFRKKIELIKEKEKDLLRSEICVALAKLKEAYLEEFPETAKGYYMSHYRSVHRERLQKMKDIKKNGKESPPNFAVLAAPIFKKSARNIRSKLSTGQACINFLSKYLKEKGIEENNFINIYVNKTKNSQIKTEETCADCSNIQAAPCADCGAQNLICDKKGGYLLVNNKSPICKFFDGT